VCQVLFQPRFLANSGWTDGEACERLWSAIRHVIAGLRASMGWVRRQTLTHVVLYVAEVRHINIGSNFPILIARALENESENTQNLKDYFETHKMTLGELQDQAEKHQNFFHTPIEAMASIDEKADRICELITIIDNIENYTKAYQQMRTNTKMPVDSNSFQLKVNIETGGGIDLALDGDPERNENELESLRTELQTLLTQTRGSLTDWKNDDRSPTVKHQLQMEDRKYRDLRRMGIKIWTCLLHRKAEYQQLFGASRLGISLFNI
jgi:hypothetical protein